MKTHWLSIISVISILSSSPSIVCHAKPIPEASLRWADRLAADRLDPTKCIEGIRWGSIRTEEAYQWLLVKFGPNARAYNGVARSQMQLGNYTGAQQAYEKSLALSPNNPVIEQELQTCLTLVHVAEQITPMLPKGQSLVRVCALPDNDQQKVWIALSARVGTYAECGYDMYTFITLTVVKDTDGVFAIQSQLAPSGFYYREIDDAGYADVQLFVLDLSGDGQPEIVVHENYVGGSWMPSHLLVYQWRANQLVKMLGVSGDDRLVVKDLKHDGRYEIINQHAIGRQLCHADMPRWTNVYAYKNGTFQLANGDYPSEFTDLQKEIQEQLLKFPHDPELLQYLGTTYEIQKKPLLAIRAYKMAIKYYDKETHHDDDRQLRADTLITINDINKRIEALKKHGK